jgi:bifunctional enzyme CysN/CysC/sulfate adenylyltransferase subunit 1
VEGVREQTKRHAYVLSLLGIRQVVVTVNKLDMVGYDRKVFEKVENDIRTFLHSVQIVPSYVIPVSAREGENMAQRLGNTPWYGGPTVLEALDTFENVRADSSLPLRLPVQDVYKWDGKRIYVGRVETGEIRAGDEVIFLPSGKITRVKSVEKWQKPDLPSAVAGECIGITTEDELFVERGEVIARRANAPVKTREVRASIFWLADRPFQAGKSYTLKLATAEVTAVASVIEERLDSSTLEVSERHAPELFATEVGNVVFSLKNDIAADLYGENIRRVVSSSRTAPRSVAADCAWPFTGGRKRRTDHPSERKVHHRRRWKPGGSDPRTRPGGILCHYRIPRLPGGGQQGAVQAPRPRPDRAGGGDGF